MALLRLQALGSQLMYGLAAHEHEYFSHSEPVFLVLAVAAAASTPIGFHRCSFSSQAGTSEWAGLAELASASFSSAQEPSCSQLCLAENCHSTWSGCMKVAGR